MMRQGFVCFFTVIGLLFPAWAAPLISDETGFEGAVTVVSEEDDGPLAVITANVPFLDVYGEAKEGLARLVIEKKRIESGEILPSFCHVHYEFPVDSGKKQARQGWAAFTAAYDETHPIDPAIANGYNQARAIVQWARRLPFTDPVRLHIDGGSQGGYAALAVSADLFPVTSATPNAPVVNWSYNLNYFEANRAVSKYPSSLDDSPLPVVCAVTMLADWCYKFFGEDLSAEAYYRVSPIAYLGRIANPVLLTCATGDMLVPMEQMTRGPLPPYDPAKFPEGYQRDFETLTPCVAARKTFEECIPEDRREVFTVPRQEDSFELTLEMFKDPKAKPKKRPKSQEKPWSKNRQWSLVYCDEGPPVPQAGHVSWEWNLSNNDFIRHHKTAPIGPEILNAEKLRWLVQRLERSPDGLPLLATGQPANRFNFPDAETRDVIEGLKDYAALSPAHRACFLALAGETGAADALGKHAELAALMKAE